MAATRSEQKIVQYLNEAHATELTLVRVLQSQIAMTPRGSYRNALERHLGETEDHANRVERRLGELRQGGNPLNVVFGAAQAVMGQAFALAKTPVDLVRGTGGEERILKNAKDACATEALEIATYAAIERLAKAVGDERTERLATSIKADEERMLDRVMREIPKLTDAVVGAEIEGHGSDAVGSTARKARKTRKAPASDRPIARYDSLTAEEIAGKLSTLSQAGLAKVEAYERSHKNRAGVLKAAEREASTT